MTRSPGAAGFNGRSAPVASSRLTDAVAASLAIGSLSLCLIVTLTVLSIKVAWRCRFRRNRKSFPPKIISKGHSQFCATTRDARHRDRVTMKTPVVLVTATLAAAILLAASLLIATGTRGEGARAPPTALRSLQPTLPASK